MPIKTAIDFPPATFRGNGWRVVEQYVPASGQTFVKGDVVLLDANGQLIVGAAVGSNIAASKKPWGIANENAADALAQESGRQQCSITVPIHTSAQWLTQVTHGTTASAVIPDTILDTPTTLPLKRVAAGQFAADLEHDGTDDYVVIVERAQGFSGTDTMPYVWVQFLRSVSLWDA